MSNTIAVNEPRSLDEFAGWTDEVDSHDDEQLSERSIIGQRLKFTNEGQWQLPDKTEPTKSLIVVNARRSAVKWGKTKGRPLETEFVKAGERFPDLKTRNAALPPSEWITDFNGNPKGPWEAQHIVYLVDPISIDQYTYPTSTTGGHIAVQELVERVNWMRRFRGPATYPIVQLATRFMKTKYGGGRLRPHFSIVDWTRIEPGGGAIPASEPQHLLPPAEQAVEQTVAQPAEPVPVEPVPAVSPAEKLQTVLRTMGAQTVEPPTAKEVTGDEIPF